MARPCAYDKALDRRATTGTGKIGTAVNEKTFEVLPSPPVGKQIGQVVETRPTVLDGRRQDFADSGSQTAQLGG